MPNDTSTSETSVDDSGAGLGTETGVVADAADAPSNVAVQILAINDFHGNLEAPAGSGGVVVAKVADPIADAGAESGVKVNGDAGTALVPAGGAAFLAAHIKQLKATNPNTVIVSAGDLTGASPLVSNLFHDEPAVLVMKDIHASVQEPDGPLWLEDSFHIVFGDGPFETIHRTIASSQVPSFGTSATSLATTISRSADSKARPRRARETTSSSRTSTRVNRGGSAPCLEADCWSTRRARLPPRRAFVIAAGLALAAAALGVAVASFATF